MSWPTIFTTVYLTFLRGKLRGKFLKSLTQKTTKVLFLNLFFLKNLLHFKEIIFKMVNKCAASKCTSGHLSNKHKQIASFHFLTKT